MQDKMIFREMLNELKVYADSKDNKLSQKEIKEFFADAHLEEAQYEFIYEYLESQKIMVEGYCKAPVKVNPLAEDQNAAGADEPEDPEAALENNNLGNSQGKPDKQNGGRASEEDAFLKMYLSDLEDNRTEEMDEGTKLNLYHLAADNDPMAKSRLIEQNLRRVYDLAMNYKNKELPKSDLIQEGNIGLMLGIDAITKQNSLSEYHKYINSAIIQALDEAVREQTDLKHMDQQLVEQVNFVNEAIKNLEQDLEHKVSIDELSAYIEMPIEEIRYILKIAGDDIEIDGEHHSHS